MKKIIILIIASGMISLAGPLSAVAQKKESSEKELCILYAQDCANKVYNLQEKIRKIQDELAKGAKIYNADEIKRLKDKLNESEDMMDKLMPNPSVQK